MLAFLHRAFNMNTCSPYLPAHRPTSRPYPPRPSVNWTISHNNPSTESSGRFKGPVINHGQGGGGATKWDRLWVRNFLCPTSRQGNTFCALPPPSPPFKGWTLFVSSYSVAKTSSSHVKTTSKPYVPPFSMAEFFSQLHFL